MVVDFPKTIGTRHRPGELVKVEDHGGVPTALYFFVGDAMVGSSFERWLTFYDIVEVNSWSRFLDNFGLS